MVALLAVAVFAASTGSARAEFTGGSAPADGGIMLAVWNGGTIDTLPDAAAGIGCDLRSAWAVVAGRFTGSIVGAPAFVSADFNTRFAAGIPGGTPLVLVCSPGGPDPQAPPAPDAGPKLPWNPPPSYPGGFLDYSTTDYVVRERVIFGTTVEVAIHESVAAATSIDGEATHTPATFAELVFDAFEAHLRVFGTFPYDRYRMVVRGPGDDPLGYFITSEWGVDLPMEDHRIGGSAIAGPPHAYTRDFARDWVVHEMFHAWNGSLIQAQPIGGDLVYQAESWFTEGATVYYAARTFNDAFFREELADAAAEYRGASAADRALSFDEIASRTPAPPAPGMPPGYNDYVGLLYQKGALVAYLLDDALRDQRSSLDELMRAMFEEFGGTGERYTNADVRRLAVSLGGPSLSAFFDAYVDGGAALPLPSSFTYFN
jgi:hypothetical protein